MLTFLKELPTIYHAIFTLVFLGVLWLITRERELLILVNIVVGGVIGIAKATNKPSHTVNTESIENAEISVNDAESKTSEN